jgi:hypothetical protein
MSCKATNAMYGVILQTNPGTAEVWHIVENLEAVIANEMFKVVRNMNLGLV